MRQVLILTLVILLKASIVLPQDKTTWLEQNTYELNSIDPTNEDYSDLKFLIPILKGKDIVLLGEEDHTFASTFAAKSRLIKFLHKELGFDVLAFETDIYMMSKFNAQSNKTKKVNLQNILYPSWGKATTTQDLIQYIENTKDSKNPIQLAGFDYQIFYSYNILNDLKTHLESYDSDILNYRNFEIFEKRLIDFYRNSQNVLSREAFVLMSMFLDDILFQMDIRKSYSRKEKLLFQSLKNLKFAIYANLVDEPTRNYQLGNLNPDDSIIGFIGDLKSMGALNRRDKMMAENIVWAKNEFYPSKKMIVWAASEHTMYNRNKVKKEFPEDFPFHARYKYGYSYKSMGSYLKETFGHKLYNIGFSTINGQVDYSRDPKIKYINDIVPEKNSIEELLQLKTKKESHPFLDFSTNETKMPTKIFNEKMLSNILGGTKTIGDISTFFDGVLFLKNAKPIKYIN